MPHLRQDAPYPINLDWLVTHLQYRPGWEFSLEDVQRDEDHGRGTAGGLTFLVTITGYNSYHVDQGPTYRVTHVFPVPAATYDRRSWQRWVFDCLVKVETHECMEFFRFEFQQYGIDDDGDPFVERPYAPSHGPGNDPYIVREVGTREDQRTSFRGELN